VQDRHSGEADAIQGDAYIVDDVHRRSGFAWSLSDGDLSLDVQPQRPRSFGLEQDGCRRT
jgi:hypothetical protein